MKVKVWSECEWGLDRVCGTKLRGRQASQRWLHAPRRKKDGGRIVNSEAKRKGVEVPERRGCCWGGTGSGRGGAIVYQGRDTVRRAGRGQGRAEVSVKRGE